MPRVARKGDYHEGVCGHGAICCPHSVAGPIVEGSSNVFTNSKLTARLHDEVTHDCPHCGTGYIAEGSSTVFVNNKPIARIGDRVVYPGGSGVIIEGSSDVFSG